MTKEEMIKTLPTLYRQDKWVNEIYNLSQINEVDKLSHTNYDNIFSV